MKKLLFGVVLSLFYAQFLGAQPLRLATDMSYPPFQFLEKGELKGVETEILAEISKRTGLEFKPEKTPFDKIFSVVEYGNADIAMSAIDITPERLVDFDFSESYYTTTNIFVALEGKFNSIENLKNAKIGVISPESTQEELAKRLGNEVIVCNSLMNGVLYLNNGKIDALIIESVATPIVVHNRYEFLSEKEKQGLDMLKSFGTLKKAEVFHIDFEGSAEQGLMVKKGTFGEELEKINKAIKDMKDDGTIETIIKKYGLQ